MQMADVTAGGGQGGSDPPAMLAALSFLVLEENVEELKELLHEKIPSNTVKLL